MITSNSTAEWFHAQVAARDEALSRPRHAFEDWLDSIGADADVRSELSIVFSELLANAAGATGGRSDDDISVRAWHEQDSVLLEVVNPVSAHRQAITHWDLADPLRGGGRGLLIVRAYTDDLRVHTVGGCIVVRCRRQLTAA